jgi:nucleotide-binding universal stress UspA family protein
VYTRILVPLDGSATAEAVLPYAQAFAAGFKTSVELLSVLDIGAMATHLSADKVPELNAIVANEEKKSTTYLANVAKSLFSRFPTDAGLFAAIRRRPFLKSRARTAIH